MIITRESIKELFDKNNWKDTEIVCPDGTIAVVTPCSDYYEVNENTVCFFIVRWDIPYCDAYTIDELVDILNNHEKYVEQDNESRDYLSKLWKKIKNNEATQEDIDIYSDLYKEVHGCRPIW